MSPSWEVREGNCIDLMRAMPAGSVQCCITSPPYFGLRDYDLPPNEWGDGWIGCLGLEPTPGQFIAHLVEVFAEVRRVLRDDGTLWVNMGDSYANDSKWGGSSGGKHVSALHGAGGGVGRGRRSTGCKGKDLIGIPWLLAFALRAEGWYLRSDIIWHKPNPMPESITDRPTSAHEHLFLLAKSPRYFYDADAIREPDSGRITPAPCGRAGIVGAVQRSRRRGNRGLTHGAPARDSVLAAATSGNVWTVATQPYADAHFATFPPKLIEPCVLAGSAERACGECGAPWERVVEREVRPPRGVERAWSAGSAVGQPQRDAIGPPGNGLNVQPTTTLGFAPSCDHDDGAATSTVLDPFSGAGTTGLVALRHGRSFVGLELSPVFARWPGNASGVTRPCSTLPRSVPHDP